MVREFLGGFLSLVQGRHWGFEERRQGLIRLRCSYKCIYSHAKSRLPGTIVDLGEGGLALSHADPLGQGQQLKVYCPFIDLEGPCAAVEGSVCWTRVKKNGSHRSGLKINVTPESWVSAILQMLGFPGQGEPSKRRWIRADCNLPARLGDHDVKVHNLGVGGALIETKYALSDGPMKIVIGPFLKLEPLQVEGRVTHLRNENLHGFQFNDLNPPQLKLLGLYLKALLRDSLPGK